MPRHKQVTTCLKGGGPLSKFCTCQHCTLSVCEVCGAYEGGLTTDCPGTRVDYDRQKEVYETSLDFTDDRGWHLGEPMKMRSPRFENTKLPPEPPRVDPRAQVAPTIDWARIDRNTALQHELAKKAIAWVLADRNCEDRSAALARSQDDADVIRARLRADAAAVLDDHDRDLLGKLEQERIDFQIANRRAEERDDEFRQAARLIVTALEISAE